MFPEETQGFSSINPIATEVPVPKSFKKVCKSPICSFMVKVKFSVPFQIFSAQSSTTNKYLVCQYVAKLFIL